MALLLSSLALLISIVSVSGFNLTATGSTVSLNGIPYYISGKPYASVPNFNSQSLAGTHSVLGGLVPVTVVSTGSVTFNLLELGQTVEGFGKTDDVWGEGFLSGMYFELRPLLPRTSVLYDLQVWDSNFRDRKVIFPCSAYQVKRLSSLL